MAIVRINELPEVVSLDDTDLLLVRKEDGSNTEKKLTTESLLDYVSEWEPLQAANFNLDKSRGYNVEASGAIVDATMPSSIESGDVFIIRNVTSSDNVVRIVNQGYIFRGKGGNIGSGDDPTVDIGDTVFLSAVSTTDLEIVSYG